MNWDVILELVGYFASLLVLISLLMTSVVKLRVINTIGSFIFAIYAVLIRSYPTAVMNFSLVGINLYFLWKLHRQKALLSLVEAEPANCCVTHFLECYREDIRQYFPAYAGGQGKQAYLVYADAEPVGILVGTPEPEGGLTVLLDYSAPKYRDCSVGTYLYHRLAQQGIPYLAASGGDDRHGKYLEKMGFVMQNGRYIKNLT